MGILKYDKSNMSEYDGVLPHHFGPSSWITSIRVLCHLRKQLDSPAIDIWSMRVCQTKLLVARNSKKVSLVQRARHFQTWRCRVFRNFSCPPLCWFWWDVRIHVPAYTVDHLSNGRATEAMSLHAECVLWDSIFDVILLISTCDFFGGGAG